MVKILIVDDNPQNLYMLQVLLKGNGYEVVSATNGAEALEKARRDPPHLIIADILMPVMDGFALCREWKQDEVLKTIPFVFYTATYTDRRDEELALSLGAERFIVKPVEPDVFVGMLREVIREAEEGRLVGPRKPVEEEAVFLSEYNEALIRKLERKMLQLEEANRALEADIAKRKRAEEQVHNLATKLKAIARPARQMSALLDPDELVSQVVQSLREITGCYTANLFLREGDELVFAAGQGGYVGGRQPVGYRLPLGQGIIGHVAQSGQPVLVSDVSQDSRYMAWEGLPHTRSELAVPVKRGDRVLGVVDMQAMELDAFDAADLEALGVLADQLAVSLENAQLFEETQRRLEYLRALRNVDLAITGSLDLRVTLDVLLDQTTAQLHVDAAALLLFNSHMKTLEYAAGRGFHIAALQHTRLRLGEGLAGRAALERRIVSVADLREDRDVFQSAPLLDIENFISYFGVPLIAKGEIKGVLEVFHRTPLDPSQEWVGFLETLAGQAAIAIDNAELFEGLQRSNVELALAYDTTLEGWAKTLELRDYETEGHSERVVQLTLRLARAMGVSGAGLVHIRRGALLHDIGKMGISDTILLKPGPLTEEEWEIMRQHPVYAHELLSSIGFLGRALDIPYCHHEKWDGTGYPQGLKGEQIPLAARVFAVVDVWDALCSVRPYRDAWSKEKAIEYIREQAGQQFDPKVVEMFLDVMDEE